MGRAQTKAHLLLLSLVLPAAVSMAAPLPGNPPPTYRAPLGLWANAKKRKDSFVQLLFMTGILLLSMRSLGQKHRLNDLAGDAAALREEHRSLSEKMDATKKSLLREAALDKSGVFAARVRRLFDPSRS